MSAHFSMQDLSAHLFWDLNRDVMSLENSKNIIIHRVLEYGMMKDWELIKKVYGLEEIKKAGLQFKNLDPVTLSFLSNYFQIDKTAFRCYTNTQSNQNFWNS